MSEDKEKAAVTKTAKCINVSYWTVNEHAQALMSKLGITYKEAIPQSMHDCWDFLFCENVPDELPRGVTAYDEMPECYVTPGWGRSQEAIDRNGI